MKTKEYSREVRDKVVGVFKPGVGYETSHSIEHVKISEFKTNKTWAFTHADSPDDSCTIML